MARIVVCDRAERRQLFYEQALEGHLISFVDRPIEAVALCRAFPQDLVIAEWFDVDGPRVIEEMNKFYDFTPPPVVLTADIRSSDKVEAATIRAIDKGAAWLIPFPMSRAAFRQEVESVIEEFSAPFGDVRGEITDIIPPSENATGLCAMLHGVHDVQMMIEQTTGWEYLEQMISVVVREEGVDAAQHSCARIFEWAASDMPTLHAAAWSAKHGNGSRTPSQELLFRIAHGMLFPGTAAA